MSSANGTEPIDLFPPIRDIDQIVKAHDVLKHIVLGKLERFKLEHLSPEHAAEIKGASMFACWVLQDGNESEFGDKFEHLEETLADLGYIFSGTGN